MVTDPRSIPNARLGRIVWAVCIAIVTFILRNYFFIPTAVFWALFALAPFTILVDVLWSAPQFSWLRGEREQGAGEPARSCCFNKEEPVLRMGLPPQVSGGGLANPKEGRGETTLNLKIEV